MTSTGGKFQASHGENEQQDGIKGFTAMTAREFEEILPMRINGEESSPSQVWVGGNSRKSSLTISFSISLDPDVHSPGFLKLTDTVIGRL